MPHEPTSTFHDGDGGRHAAVLVKRGLSRASGVRVCSPCRAHLFALDVLLCAPISSFAFVAESAKARARRHGPELHRWLLIACRLRFCLACCSWRLAGLHFLLLGLSGETMVFFLWFLLAPVRREEVSVPLSHPARGIRLRYDLGSFSRIFINGAHGVPGVFKVARRQWRATDGQWARGSKLCRARPQTWWSDFVRFPDTQRASSEGFQVHVADSSCSLSLRHHCDGHRETSVLAQLRRGSWSWCSYAVSQMCSVCWTLFLHAPRIRHSIVRYLCRLRSTSKFILAGRLLQEFPYSVCLARQRIQYRRTTLCFFSYFLCGNGLRILRACMLCSHAPRR